MTFAGNRQDAQHFRNQYRESLLEMTHGSTIPNSSNKFELYLNNCNRLWMMEFEPKSILLRMVGYIQVKCRIHPRQSNDESILNGQPSLK